MTISVSHALSNALLDTGAFNSVFDLCFLDLYAGTVPENIDPALPDCEADLGGATLLRTYTDNDGGNGLSWEANAVQNVIFKDSTQVWSGTSVATGTATFFRLRLTGDTGVASTTDFRVQGTVGTAIGDLLLPTTAITTGVLHVIENFGMYLLSPS